MKRIVLVFLVFISSVSIAQPSLTLEQRLTRLEDIEAIRTLLHNYGRYNDERNWQAFSELYSEDEGTVIGALGVAVGRQEIYDMMNDSMDTENISANGQGISNVHLTSNEFIEIDGLTATALSKWVFVQAGENGGPEMVLVGHYDDELIKEEGVWRFKTRTISADIMGSMALPEPR